MIHLTLVRPLYTIFTQQAIIWACFSIAIIFIYFSFNFLFPYFLIMYWLIHKHNWLCLIWIYINIAYFQWVWQFYRQLLWNTFHYGRWAVWISTTWRVPLWRQWRLELSGQQTCSSKKLRTYQSPNILKNIFA